jgi:hypothetical protein
VNRREILTALAGSAAVSLSPDPVFADGHGHGEGDVDGKVKLPPGGFHLYLCAFHIAKKDPGFVVEAHHYCSPVADDVHQCVIFDKHGRGGRILGVEYIISDALYRELPAAEKKYWHPHAYEILSGLLVCPGMEAEREDKMLSGLIRSWGKTWHTWPDPATALPTGEPLLMWSSTRDGMIPADRVAARDRRLGISTPAIRRRRAALGKVPQTAPPASISSLGRQFTDGGPDEPRD